MSTSSCGVLLHQDFVHRVHFVHGPRISTSQLLNFLTSSNSKPPSSVFDIRCSIFGVRCSMFNVQCSMFDVRCSIFGVRCLIFGVRCLIFGVQCSMFGSRFSALYHSNSPPCQGGSLTPRMLGVPVGRGGFPSFH